MADPLDYIFFFFFGLTLAVYLLGSIYEKQVETKRGSDRAKTEATKEWRDPWAPPPSLDDTWPTSTSPSSYQPPVPSHSYSSQTSAPHNLNRSHDQQQQQLYRRTEAASSARRPDDFNDQLSGLEPAADQAISSCDIPTASGFNPDCVEWVNSILFLLYSQPQKYAPILEESVCRSLNEKLSSIIQQQQQLANVMVEFVGINKRQSSRPELANVRTESESDKSVSAVCKIYNETLVLELTIQRLATGHPGGLAHYELTLERLEGKLKSVAMSSDRLVVVQFMEKPDTKILLRRKQLNNNKPADPEQQQQIINEDQLVSLVLQTLTQVVVDLYFGDDPDFPHYHKQSTGYKQRLQQLKGSASEIKRQIKHDFFGSLLSSGTNDQQQHDAANPKERKLFIKILRARNINYNQNVTCLLELDQPYQQALSSTKPGASNPYWDEHFLFTVSDKSGELALELWDSVNSIVSTQTTSSTAPNTPQPQKRRFFGGSSSQQQPRNTWSKADLTQGAKFLGLARVSLEALKRNPVQTASLALESKRASQQQQQQQQKPNEATTTNLDELSQSVGGELQVELLFLEHSKAEQATLDPSALSHGGSLKKSSSLSSMLALQAGNKEQQQQLGEVVSVERKVTPAGYVITTTTITKPARSARSRQSRQPDQLSVVGGDRNQSPGSRSSASELGDAELLAAQNGDSDAYYSHQGRLGDPRSVSPSTTTADLDAQEQQLQRPHRSRSRSFLRAIKKRFSFSRQRSRSVGPGGGGCGDLEADDERRAAGSRQADLGSLESRSRASSVASHGARAKSVPVSRGGGGDSSNEVPTIVINRGGRLSDTASAFTFAHPKSQLVLECAEPRLAGGDGPQSRPHYRYYALSERQASRWRKRGTKLHLFNEHQFVACHLAGSSTCHLCGRVFSRRPGKQGYKCRNCHLLSHKQCHVKVDHQCPYAAPDGLQLEFIDADPPEALMASAAAAAESARRTSPMMVAKSISVDVDVDR